jgi:protein FAM32A
MSQKPIVIAGKLKFKSSKASSGASVKKVEVKAPEVIVKDPQDDVADSEKHLTAAQRKHESKKRKLEGNRAKDIIEGSYRDRIEKFNLKLSTMSEHNDIPRISAAGNG